MKASRSLPFPPSCDIRDRDTPEKTSRNQSLRKDLSFVRDRGGFFRSRFGGYAVAFFFLASDVIEQRDGIFKFFQHRVLDHLGIDHVLELELVEREHGDHLHETRRQNLPLRQLDVQFVLKKQRFSLKNVPGSQFSANKMYLTYQELSGPSDIENLASHAPR